ncbi:IS481 family transposase [Nonomuraea turcica]|uniref:IS481 family transposase n=1 Tax=Nonomuraea sp. G32 TaxID=3067274 RepID=UPI00273B779A|nr:IS481 family transposase [Nonomuraea sp. G32]MDP4511889.1 IS481 family transposase [Nonomuraea sp. G32]
MRELSVAEQRYKAVLAVISDGRTVTEVARAVGVSRQSLHAWLARYEAEGLEGLKDRSHRPHSCPHQMPGAMQALVLELRRQHRSWGPKRIAAEIARRDPVEAPSVSAIYRCLVRAGLIEPDQRRRRRKDWKRFERARPMELWQMDLIGGFLLADGGHAKALTGIDDHSRYCVTASLMPRERTRPVCEALLAALSRHGVPEQILTDNAKVFTGRFFTPPTEVLFDRICRENGIEHLLTAPRSPTTTGKIERFHRTLRAEFDTSQTFSSLRTAQQALDEWVDHYNTSRPHQSLDEATPASRFHPATHPTTHLPTAVPAPAGPDRSGQGWVTRKVAANGVVCVAWQQISVGQHRAGQRCDVLVTDQLLQLWIGEELLKTVARTSSGPIRKKNAEGSGRRHDARR